MKSTSLILTSLLGANLIACSPSIDAGGGSANPFAVPDTTFSNKVPGPKIDGDWASECIASQFGGNSRRRVYLKIQAPNFEQTDVNFSDSQCNVVRDKKEIKGELRFTKALKDNVYTVEYKIPVNNYASTWQFRNLSVDGETMKLSDFQVEEAKLANQPLAIELINRGPTEVKPSLPGGTVPAQPANIVLQSGTYSSPDVNGRYCEEVVSTAVSRGSTVGLGIQSVYPCGSGYFEFSCKGNVCEEQRGGLVVTIKDSKSYEIRNVRTNKTTTYTKL